MNDYVFEILKAAIRLEISNKVIMGKNEITIILNNGQNVRLELKKISV